MQDAVARQRLGFADRGPARAGREAVHPSTSRIGHQIRARQHFRNCDGEPADDEWARARSGRSGGATMLPNHGAPASPSLLHALARRRRMGVRT
jgi:hypothetical protein